MKKQYNVSKATYMRLPGLKRLHQSMIDHNVARCHFEFTHNGTKFSVVFIADEKPFTLGLVTKGAHPLFLKLEIHDRPEYSIDVFLGMDQYRQLCEALGLDPSNRARTFRTSDFFRYLDAKIPMEYKPANKCQPHHVAPLHPKIEEASKVYLLCLRCNSEGVHVTLSNLLKTKTLLGLEAYAFCKKNNISTCWTDCEELAIKISIEELIRSY